MKVVRAALLCGCLASVAPRATAQCSDEACVKVSSNLASVSTQQSALLDATLTSLLGLPLGNAVDLSVADGQALASANLSLSGLLQTLNEAGVGSTAAGALGTAAPLGAVLSAAAVQATAQGNAAAAAALEKLRAQSASVNTQDVTLGELIQVDTRAGPLSNNQLNALDLVTGSASLFNAGHVAALRSVSLNGNELGLGNTSSATLSVVVLEPARIVCGPVGSQFSSASTRIRVHLDLTGIGVDLTVPALASVRLNLTKLDLIASVGRASGTLDAIDALAGTLRVQATPGLAELFLGTVSDASFLDRATPIDPVGELTPATLGDLALQLALLNATAAVSAKGHASGAAPTPSTLTFTQPYPRTLTASTSANFAGNLLDTLLGSLQVTVGAYSSNLGLVGGALTTLVDNVLAAVTTALRSSADGGVLKGVLTPTLGSVVDPLLSMLGVELGEVSITASAPYKVSTGSTCSDNLYCTQDDLCGANGVCTGTPRSCSDGLDCTDDVCNELADSCTHTVSTTSCRIGGVCVAANAPDPGSACRACLPASSTAGYSTKPNGALCNDGLFCTATDSCVAGLCVGTPRSCADDIACTVDSCNEASKACLHVSAGGCVIGGACVIAGATSPQSPCKICDPLRSLVDWSPATAGTRCDDGLFCTLSDTCDASGSCVGSGARCPSDGLTCTNEVCDEASDRCTAAVMAGCRVEGQCFVEGAASPDDACQVCRPSRALDAFTYDACAARCDSDGDGLLDCHESAPDGSPVEHDDDGMPDRQDPDDDGDGIPTRDEYADPNGDGNPGDSRDLDEDGVPDYLDADDDNDGRPTRQEREEGQRYGDDIDGDGVDSWYDFDSDEDGATDAAENYSGGDSNGDGTPDYLQPEVQPPDDDRDGLPTQLECPTGEATCPDTDGDGIRDGDDPDDDADGVLTRYELRNGQLRDTDGDGSFDHLDRDDDGDTLPTRDEQPDPDGDGDPSDARDTDRDGKPDYLDSEGDGRDANGNGVPDYLEADGGAEDAALGPRGDGGNRPSDAAVVPSEAGSSDAGTRRGDDGGCALTDRNEGTGWGALWVLAALGGIPWRRSKR
jgi:hypothetical protein